MKRFLHFGLVAAMVLTTLSISAVSLGCMGDRSLQERSEKMDEGFEKQMRGSGRRAEIEEELAEEAAARAAQEGQPAPQEEQAPAEQPQ
ncbi:MAG: hypothetical protein HYV26_17635 [Candidatus Hydrogenedentes bacterium]|nr:hypothetical protein [Candidatus Hydrogenedentota bacterium]